MGPQQISNSALIICFLLLIIPLVISRILRLNLVRTILLSAARMGLQLLLMAVFLILLMPPVTMN